MSYPEGCLWRVASSACRVEGAWDEDGWGTSVRDAFVRLPFHVADDSTGDVDAACHPSVVRSNGLPAG